MSTFEAIGPVANRLALWNERRAKINAETDHPGAETLCTLANAQRRHVSALLARAGRDRALASLDPSGLPPA